ncbi:3-beta hydroxysteroid dehydrogenase/isomerase family-domain-containing protein, partial [Pisolithus tinctorius]
QEEDTYLTANQSEFIGRRTIEQLARGDTVPVLDIVQRHHGHASFYLEDITDERDVLDILNKSGVAYIVQNALLRRGTKDPSIYFRGYVEGTRAIIDGAITAGVRKLVYTSSTGVVFDSTDVVNVDEQVPYLEKPFDTYNDSKAQGEKIVLEANGKDGLLTIALRPAGVFGSRDSQIGGSRSLFDCTYNGNIARTILLAGNELVLPPSCSSTMSSEPRLDPEGATAKLNESLHRALPPICATTECHCMTRTLGPYVTPPPNAESILSAYNTPFDPREPTGFVVHSRADEQASFITNGKPIYILEVTELF